jgi:hypothetical protein
MITHTYLLHHKPLRTAWTLWLVELGIAVLAVVGLYYAVSNWMDREFTLGLVALGSLTGTAVIYAFGYLWCMPDVLGGIHREDARSLRQRWFDFALLTTFLAILVIVGAYIRAIWVNHFYISVPGAIALVLGCCWILPACVVASEKYLSWTMPGREIEAVSGWRFRVRRTTRAWGNWLINIAGIKRALVAGGALALVSLLLPLGDEFFNHIPGYKIVTGSQNWPMPWIRDEPQAGALLLQAMRDVYLVGLAIAAVALLALVPGRLGKAIQNSRVLTILAATIALLHISNFALAFDNNEFRLDLWMLLWTVPIVVWLRVNRGDAGHWDRTRIAIMVFCLPIFLIGLALLVTFTYMSLGLGSFVTGMLLVWWGLVQSRHGNDQQQEPLLSALGRT